DEVLSLMSHIAAKVPSHNAVPSGAITTGIYLLYMSCNILLNVVFLQGLSGRARHWPTATAYHSFLLLRFVSARHASRWRLFP
uniref:Uncharacterized protein n=1 Tax=Chelonoidis abingdonii TaxID=106734 RepID=A0A8C0J1S0_CHEAB